MADLAARLRDVLTPELRERSDFHRPQDWQDVMVSALLPLLSSLLEEREREIREVREALEYYDENVEMHTACPFCLAGMDARHNETCPVQRAGRLLSRLASSSSPGEEK